MPMEKLLYRKDTFLYDEKEQKQKVNPLKIKHITHVFSGSPAEKLGIQPGDCLIKVNNRPASDVDIDDLPLSESVIHYQMYRRSEEKDIRIKAPNLPLGVKIENTCETMLKRAKNQELEYEELYQLWERKEWKSLLKVCLREQGFDSFIFGRLHKLFKEKELSPVLLMHGIALYEMGEVSEAIELIEDYYENAMNSWTTEWHALTFYYLGLYELANSNRDNAFRLLHASAHYCRCYHLSLRLNDLGIKTESKTPWTDHPFPINFELQTFDKSLTVNLSETLDKMDDEKLLYVFVMPSYRANGPYGMHLEVYNKILKSFPERTSQLYVITDTPTPSERMEWVMKKEERLVAEGMDLIILNDEHSIVSEQLKQSTTPNFYIINKKGDVINSGMDFEISDYWGNIEKAFGSDLVKADTTK